MPALCETLAGIGRWHQGGSGDQRHLVSRIREKCGFIDDLKIALDCRDFGKGGDARGSRLGCGHFGSAV